MHPPAIPCSETTLPVSIQLTTRTFQRRACREVAEGFISFLISMPQVHPGGLTLLPSLYLHGFLMPYSRKYELERIAVLNALNVLDRDLGKSLDPITQLAAFTFDVPIVLVTIVDADAQHFISKVGTQITYTERDISICACALDAETDILEIPDLSKDQLFASNPMVAHDPFLRFYAGAALVTGSGHPLGTLCLADYKPRQLSAEERRQLLTLSRIVMTHIELKLSVGRRELVSGMHNHRQLQADLRMLAARKTPETLYAVMTDVMNSQTVNDAWQVLGVSPMESLIRQAGHRLMQLLGDDAKVYHVGSTRFAFICRGHSKDAMNALLLRLNEGMRAQVLASGVPMTPLFHAGVVPFHATAAEAEDVMRKALIAMHAAINAETPMLWYDPLRDDQLKRAYRLAIDARDGLQGGEFHLLYQPRVRLCDLKVSGAEALLRWNHPDLGLVNPDELIPVLEKTALMLQVTRWVIAHAIAQLAQWHRTQPHLHMSLNLSAHDFNDEGLNKYLLSVCADHRIDPHSVEIEITEGQWIKSHKHALPQLIGLKAHGIRIAIDDFGSGYSNFGYLAELPINVIKLDRSLVSGLATSPTTRLKTQAVINLTCELGYTTVAEGIENLDELRLLTEWGCDEGQGYLLARPMEAAQALRLASGPALDPRSYPMSDR